jgi:hypothetical protein
MLSPRSSDRGHWRAGIHHELPSMSYARGLDGCKYKTCQLTTFFSGYFSHIYTTRYRIVRVLSFNLISNIYLFIALSSFICSYFSCSQSNARITYPTKMRCYRTVVQILLIVSVINVVLAAPIAVREMHEVRVNVMDVKDGGAASRKRLDPWEQSTNGQGRMNAPPSPGSSEFEQWFEEPSLLTSQESSSSSSSAPSSPTSSTGSHPGLTDDSPPQSSWKRGSPGNSGSSPSSPTHDDTDDTYEPSSSPSTSIHPQSSGGQLQQDISQPPPVSGPTDRISVSSSSPPDDPHHPSSSNQWQKDGSSPPDQGPIDYIYVSSSSPSPITHPQSPWNQLQQDGPHHPSLSNQGQQGDSSPPGQGPTDHVHVSSPSPLDGSHHPSLSNQDSSSSASSGGTDSTSSYFPSSSSSDGSNPPSPNPGDQQQGGTSPAGSGHIDQSSAPNSSPRYDLRPPSSNRWKQDSPSPENPGHDTDSDYEPGSSPSDSSHPTSSWNEGADSYRWNQEPMDDHSPSSSLSSSASSTVPPLSMENRPPPSLESESQNFFSKLLNSKFHIPRRISDSVVVNALNRALDQR